MPPRKRRKAVCDVFARLPVDTIGTILSFMTRKWVVHHNYIDRRWQEASMHVLCDRVEYTTKRFDGVHKSFWDWFSLVAYLGSLREIKLQLSASMKTVPILPAPLPEMFMNLRNLELSVCFGEAMGSISKTFENLLVAVAECGSVELETLTVQSFLTDELLEGICRVVRSGFCHHGQAFLKEFRLTLLEPDFVDESDFYITEHHFANLVEILQLTGKSLEVFSVLARYHHRALFRPIRDPRYGGEKISDFPDQEIFLECVSKMDLLRDFEFDFFPDRETYLFPPNIANIALRVVESAKEGRLHPTPRMSFMTFMDALPKTIETVFLSAPNETIPRDLGEVELDGSIMSSWKKKFTRLTGLSVMHTRLNLDKLIRTFAASILPCFPRLTDLSIVTENIYPYDQITQVIIEHAPEIRHLSLLTDYPQYEYTLGDYLRNDRFVWQHSKIERITVSANYTQRLFAPKPPRPFTLESVKPLAPGYFRPTLAT